jgi:hypothetical protein
MSEIQATAVLVLFFALRCVVPLMITLAIGYLLNRLADRWDAADLQQVGDSQPIGVIAAKKAQAAGKLPCWVVRGCDAEKRASCPAYLNQSLPCWIARLTAEGAMPKTCPDCPVYEPKLVIS